MNDCCASPSRKDAAAFTPGALPGFVMRPGVTFSAYGLFHEIISWKLRMFVPTDTSGPAVLARVMDRHPVERVGEREAV